jgi:superfamily II DNA/RNA helicase
MADGLSSALDAIDWGDAIIPPTQFRNFIADLEHGYAAAAAVGKVAKKPKGAPPDVPRIFPATEVPESIAAWRAKEQIRVIFERNEAAFKGSKGVKMTKAAAKAISAAVEGAGGAEGPSSSALSDAARGFLPDCAPMTSFKMLLRLHRVVSKAVSQFGFPAPTPIQAQAWPYLFQGCDVIGIAKTGSGKTLAFMVPCVAHMLAQITPPGTEKLYFHQGAPQSDDVDDAGASSSSGASGSKKTKAGSGAVGGKNAVSGKNERLDNLDPLVAGSPLAVVLAPTRELAQQIDVETRKLLQHVNQDSVPAMRCMCIFGGVEKGPQLQSLTTGPAVVVATPGRLLDLLAAGTSVYRRHMERVGQGLSTNPNLRPVQLKRVVYVVLDEADRMLDMGFEPQVRLILSQIRPAGQRQTLMFSATWPKEVQALAANFMGPYPVRIHIGGTDDGSGEAGTQLVANSAVRQHVQFVRNENDKLMQLRPILERFRGRRIIIFAKTKKSVDGLEARIRTMGCASSSAIWAIHGDKEQDDRTRILQSFRMSTAGGILVATDVAARGLDVKELEAVVNFDFPMCLDDYVHRIGRTGRAGAAGEAFTFVCKGEKHMSPLMVAEFVDLLKRAKQEVPNALELWAADAGEAAEEMKKIKAEQQEAAKHARLNGPALQYNGGSRPSKAANLSLLAAASASAASAAAARMRMEEADAAAATAKSTKGLKVAKKKKTDAAPTISLTKKEGNAPTGGFFGVVAPSSDAAGATRTKKTAPTKSAGTRREREE